MFSSVMTDDRSEVATIWGGRSSAFRRLVARCFAVVSCLLALFTDARHA